ncbi:MAG: NAD(P)-dependent oxidoreductase [candidate division WOR-3 bacterium]|nr:NAD(P)-dependent oxidoreductase [candidate division WOR-3 bacterium]
MAKVLVTGANGFIGSHIVEGLLEKKYQVRALVRKSANLQWIKDLPIEIFYGAISNYTDLLKAVTDIDFVIHCAGATKGITEKDYTTANVIGTQNLLKACLEYNQTLKRFIFISTISAVGPSPTHWPITETKTCTPVSIYGKTKLQAESEVLAIKDIVPSVILRLCAIYGPRDHEMLAFFKFLNMGICPVFGGLVSMCYVKDVVSATMLCLEKEILSGTIYHISDGKCYNVIDVAKVIETILGKKAIKIKVPNAMLKLYADIINFFRPNSTVLNSDKIKELIQPCWVCDIDKIKTEIGFMPQYSLEQGLKETIQWYKEHHWL